jgi:hypothetical protein
MDNKNIKKRSVMEFAEFSKAYDKAHKTVMLKDGDKAHPGAKDIKGEVLYVRNDANPYRAMGIPFDDKLADVNPKYMNANQVDVFHGRKLTAEEKKVINDAYGNQTVTHHQMAFILDESVSYEDKFGVLEKEFKLEDIDKEFKKLDEAEEVDEDFYFGIRAILHAYDEGLSHEVEQFFSQYGINNGQDTDDVVADAEGKIPMRAIYDFVSKHKSKSQSLASFSDEVSENEEADDKPKELTDADYKNMYDGKTVTLNGDNAKVRDVEGVAEIKSESNSITMPWSKVHDVMTKKSGNFRAEKKEEKDKKKDDKVNESHYPKKVDSGLRAHNAHGFLENYILDKFGKADLKYKEKDIDVEYNLDTDTTGDGSKIAFIEVYLDDEEFLLIKHALEKDYKHASADFVKAANEAGFANPSVTTGDDFISYEVTYEQSFRR